MHDYFRDYTLSEEEKEKILLTSLRGMQSLLRRQPVWLRKRRKKRIFDRLDEVYGDKCTSNALLSLKSGGFLDTKNKKYIVTEKGRIAIKRGWVCRNLLWYNTGKANKYAVIISVIAILLTAAQFVYLLISGSLE